MNVECFVTGGSGFIGQHLVAHLTARGHKTWVLMRQPEKLAALREQVQQLGGDSSRLFSVEGDLGRENLGLSPADCEAISRTRIVFHLGIQFAWGLSLEQARAINVEGARRVARLAVEQKSRLLMIGGYMLQNQPHLRRIGIDPDRPELTNWPAVYRRVGGYEGSKLEAHFATQEVMRRRGGEVTVVHPAMVCGHSRTGHILNDQPLTELIRNLAHGKLSAIPGTPEHWLPLISVDFLVELVAAAALDPAMVGQQVLALDEQTPNLQELLAQVARPLGLKAPTRHIPMRFLRLLLWIPSVAKLLRTNAESLDFIQTARFNTQQSRLFAKRHGLLKPDIRQALQRTARFVSSQLMV